MSWYGDDDDDEIHYGQLSPHYFKHTFITVSLEVAV